MTFYDLFHQRPVGRHRVSICTNLPCALRGADGSLKWQVDLLEQFDVPAGETVEAAAISSLDWVSSHDQFGRNDPTTA